jgi:hypothetical protein
MSKTNGKPAQTPDFLMSALKSGAIATSATTLALSALGALSRRDPAGPINAVSKMLFGDEEADKAEGFDAKHTLVGAALNSAAVTMWAGLHEALFGRFARKGPGQALASGALVSGLAYVVDYHVVPKRLTPGFEKKLSKGGMFTIYAVLAASFALGAYLSNGEQDEGSEEKKPAPSPEMSAG